MEPKGTKLESRLGYRFKSGSLLARALIHRSYAHENDRPDHNEPLEFLGDAVLGFLVAERIFKRREDLDEGGMTRLRASLVNMRALAQRAERLELGEELKLGVGEERSGGRAKPSILADAYEAVIGAVFLDGGVRAARSFIGREFGESITSARERRGKGHDAKTALQELLQARGWELPRYEPSGRSGPDHARVYEVTVYVQGEAAGRGEGSSKKTAEQDAARRALGTLRKGSGPK